MLDTIQLMICGPVVMVNKAKEEKNNKALLELIMGDNNDKLFLG